MTRDFAQPLTSILSAAASALVEAGRPTGRVELVPGTDAAWDDCCEGQLYLRVLEIFPTMGSGSPFPQFDSAQRGTAAQCAVNMVDVHIGLGIMRCAATLDDQGTPPSPTQVSADGQEMLDDMAKLLEVILCEVPKLPGIHTVKLDRWTPRGPLGGCHGGEWGVHLAIDPCVSC